MDEFSRFADLSDAAITHADFVPTARPRAFIVPRDVKRAIQFIQANSAAPIAVADLIGAAKVSGRTLFQHFRDFVGVPPMHYLRDIRLERAREELACGGLVTEAALRCGFTHLGRFAGAYKRRFGESPSATASRAGAPAREQLVPI